MDALCQPPTPERERAPVVEDDCVEETVHRSTAVPFFEHPKKNKILIKDGKVVNADGVVAADLLIEDGVVVEIGEDGIEADDDAKVIDATGKYVLPGGVDGSVFMADLRSCTKAAVMGGTTTVAQNVVIDVADKQESAVQAFNEAKATAEDNATACVAFVIHVNGWNDSVKAEMEELSKEHGVNSIKVDLTGFTSTEEMMRCLESCKDLGLAVHAIGYNGQALKLSVERVLARGTTGPEGHLISRPEELEVDAMNRAAVMAREAGLPVVLNGISSTASADLVGGPAFGQVGVASLVASGSNMFNSCWSHAAGFVCEPPLRDDPEGPSKMVDAVVAKSSGIMVCSHHKSLTVEDKSSGGQSDFSLIPEGVNGARERLSLVWNSVVSNEKGDPETVVELTSTNAAKALNLYPKKGCVAVGSDADLVVLDPEGFQTLGVAGKDGVDFNIYKDLKVQGRIDSVLVMGKVMAYADEFNEEAGEECEVVLAPQPFPAFLYDAAVSAGSDVGVARSLPEDLVDGSEVKQQPDTANPAGFGKTTPRCGSAQAGSQLNKSLGVYQRPMSAHGIRNQQDSTFSLAGGYNDSPSRRGVKISSPPGGSASRGSFW